MQKPLLSIGMIFKNEIRCLERCMKSLEPLRQAVSCELVMADTGSDDGSREVAERYADILIDFPSNLLAREKSFGLCEMQTYARFSEKMLKIKLETLRQFTQWKKEGKRIAAFGAAAKGNTFLNYCGINKDMIDFVVDSNPHKQGLYLPGSLVPVLAPEALRRYRPDYLVILPWNLTSEIMDEAAFVSEWGCRFVSCIPELRVLHGRASDSTRCESGIITEHV